MLHRFFSIHDASAGRNHTVCCPDLAVYTVLHFDKTVRSLLLDDFPEQLTLCFLDQQICINKLISKNFCQNDTDGTFSNTRHAY